MRAILQLLGLLKKSEATTSFQAIPELKRTQRIQVVYKKDPSQVNSNNDSPAVTVQNS